MPQQGRQLPLSQEAGRLVQNADANARNMGMPASSAHFLLAVLQAEGNEARLLAAYGVNYDFVIGALQSRQHTEQNEEFKRAVAQAAVNAAEEGAQPITERKILVALLMRPTSAVFRIAQAAGADIANLRRDIAGNAAAPSQAAGRRAAGSATAQFGTDLTELARQGKLDPVIGREQEIARVFQVLGMHKRSNPVLIGDAGVGKSAIADAVAQAIVSGNCPAEFRGKRLVSISLGAVVADTEYRGQFETRMKALIEEVRSNPEIILFIDELHVIVGAGSAEGGLDAANQLKPALANGELRCIGATTVEEYQRHIEKDDALSRRFQPVMVNPPSREQTVAILRGLRQRYEQVHKVQITDAALTDAVGLATRYVTTRQLPDSAIGLVDEACSHARQHAAAEGSGIVTAEIVAKTLEAATGIKDVATSQQRQEQLARLEAMLNERIVGNPRFCRVMHQVVNGLSDPNRPRCVVALLGPSGVGKSYAVKMFHKLMFGSPETMIYFDMGQFLEVHSRSRLIGAPPGYVGYDEGGQLTDKLRRNPSTSVMFDEFTRAHRTVLEAVFQMLEEGRIMDAQGRVCDARQAFVFLASNVPVRLDPAANVIGFAAHSQQSAAPSAEQAIKDALVQHGLDPAFVNRIDYFVLFTPFSKQDLVRVVELITDDIVREQLKEKGLKLELSEDARAFLAGKGYSEQFGAKELRRVVREELMSPLGLQLREFASGDTILASLADGRLKFSKKPKPAQGAPGAAPPAAQPAAAPQGAAPAQPAAAPEAAAPAQPAGNAQPPPAAAAIR